jgi:hypothetical protein
MMTEAGKRKTVNGKRMEMSVKPRTSYRVSFPVSRSFYGSNAHVAQSVEHVLGKDEVTSSILVVGSNEGIVMGFEL